MSNGSATLRSIPRYHHLSRPLSRAMRYASLRIVSGSSVSTLCRRGIPASTSLPDCRGTRGGTVSRAGPAPASRITSNRARYVEEMATCLLQARRCRRMPTPTHLYEGATMDISTYARRGFGICFAVALLAGCGGGSSSMIGPAGLSSTHDSTMGSSRPPISQVFGASQDVIVTVIDFSTGKPLAGLPVWLLDRDCKGRVVALEATGPKGRAVLRNISTTQRLAVRVRSRSGGGFFEMCEVPANQPPFPHEYTFDFVD